MENIELDDIGGAKELALYRMDMAKDDLAAAKMNFQNELIMMIFTWFLSRMQENK